MKKAEEMRWNYGDSLYVVAVQFCTNHSLDIDGAVKPLYNAMTALETEKLSLPPRTGVSLGCSTWNHFLSPVPFPPWDIPEEHLGRFTLGGKVRCSILPFDRGGRSM